MSSDERECAKEFFDSLVGMASRVLLLIAAALLVSGLIGIAGWLSAGY